MPDAPATDLLTQLAHADLASDVAGEFAPTEIISRALVRIATLVPGAEEAGAVLRSGPLLRPATGPLARACVDAWAAGDDVPAASALSCGLPFRTRSRGTLLLCASTPDAFGPPAEQILPNVANRLCVAIAHAEKIGHLRRAAQTRQLIGQACGILIERHKVRADEAFAMLVRASQHNHLKVRDLAAQVVETGQEPDEIRR